MDTNLTLCTIYKLMHRSFPSVLLCSSTAVSRLPTTSTIFRISFSANNTLSCCESLVLVSVPFSCLSLGSAFCCSTSCLLSYEIECGSTNSSQISCTSAHSPHHTHVRMVTCTHTIHTKHTNAERYIATKGSNMT